MWTRMTSKAQLTEVVRSVKAGSSKYDNLDVATLKNVATSGGEVWQWSAKYRINLVMIPKPMISSMKIHIFIPEGVYQARQAFKIGVRKLREIVDASPYDDYYGNILLDYGDAKLNTFFGFTKSIIWEREPDSPVKGSYQHRVFKRPVIRRPEDEKWKGRPDGR